jgi:predicted DCC family thiol-disulfide oxidoreductase YuxK
VSDVTRVASPPPKPLLVFDGECGFCRRWILRWQQATGERVDYAPFQEADLAARFPELPRTQCERAVQLIETDGAVYSAGEAVFRSLAYASRRRWPLWVYRNVPGAAPVTEVAYRAVASHRGVFSALTRLLWGQHLERPSYHAVRWVFFRWVAAVYLIAFVSLWTQIIGLVGENGILPADQRMKAVREHFDRQQVGWARYHLQPTLCWFGAGNSTLHLLCAAGTVLALLVLGGIAPAPCLFLLWLVYLSLATVCEVFLGYQWDILLLEVGFLAIWFAPARLLPSGGYETSPPSPTVLWLLRWLLFRLMFQSGCVKLLSGDVTWRNLTALNYHYETQPLPTVFGWYAHQLPEWLQRVSVVGMYVIELVVPFLIFLPRRPRLLAFWAFVALQVGIAVTGNYCFFNLLTVGLCLLLLDDAALSKFVPGRWRARLAAGLFHSGGLKAALPPHVGGDGLGVGEVLRRCVVGAVAVAILLVTSVQLAGMFRQRVDWPAAFVRIYEWLAPFRSVNSYGLFSIMTTTRPEIIVEGSNDRQTWLAYEFKHKPGNLRRAPDFVAPHQPRLDWQMWFAALGDYRGNRWFLLFCQRLLEGSPEVLRLLERNPFPDAPPRYLRAVVYDYRFTDWKTRRTEKTWWRREFKGLYCPELSLREDK